MKWKTGVCPYCETEYGTYSEDENDYGEHECADIQINALEVEIERLQKAVDEARNISQTSVMVHKGSRLSASKWLVAYPPEEK